MNAACVETSRREKINSAAGLAECRPKGLLLITVPAAVEAPLPLANPLLALRRHCNPMFDCGIPVQIAIINDLAFVQKPRARRRRRRCLFSLTHAQLYSVIETEKAESITPKGFRQSVIRGS